MLAYQKAFKILFLPFRLLGNLVRIALFMMASIAAILVAALIAYAILLSFSYLFLPLGWTEALWLWASELYEQSASFKAAMITAFILLLLPLLGLCTGSDSKTTSREREVEDLNDQLAVARRRDWLSQQIESERAG